MPALELAIGLSITSKSSSMSMLKIYCTKNSNCMHQKNHQRMTSNISDMWTKSPDGGQLLQKKRDRIKRLDGELNQSLDEASIANKSAEKIV